MLLLEVHMFSSILFRPAMALRSDRVIKYSTECFGLLVLASKLSDIVDL